MKGRRNTVQRQIIFSAIKELNVHVTAEQVFDRICLQNPAISKATVYRNLAQLACAGEIAEIGCFGGVRYYDPNAQRHYHFICNDCRQIFDVGGSFDEAIRRLICGTEGLDIEACYVYFSGLCWPCRDKLPAAD